MFQCALVLQFSIAFRNSSKSPWVLSSLSTYYTRSSEKLYPRSRKPHRDHFNSRKIIDQFRIHAVGGSGGRGCASLNYDKSEGFGKPDGGNGGRGGDVILECCPKLFDYKGMMHEINAKRGGHGDKLHKDGKQGEHKVIHVPIGTVIHLVKGEVPHFIYPKSANESLPWDNPLTEGESFESHLLCDPKTLEKDRSKAPKNNYSHEKHENPLPSEDDSSPFAETKLSETDGENEDSEKDGIQYNVVEFTEAGQQILIARGGEGGVGNASPKLEKQYKKLVLGKEGSGSFHKILHGNIWKKMEKKGDDHDDHARNEKLNPALLHEALPGTETTLILELKSIVDVGLVGIPNAGKRTLLGSISKGRSVAGSSAFTTLRPSLGKMKIGDFFTTTVLDIPGLIKAAHHNRGLGHGFLRHIERAKVLLYVLDLASAIESPKGIWPWKQLRNSASVLEYYKKGMSKRPALIVANKVDEVGADVVLEELKRRVKGVPILPTCAVKEVGVPELKEALKKIVSGEEFYSLDLDCVSVSDEDD